MVNYRFVSVFAITCLIFLIGVYFGQAISEYHLSDVKRSQEELVANLAGYELAYTILSEQDICSTNFSELQKARAELGQKVAALEEEFGQDHPKVSTLPGLYHTYQLREYFFLKDVKKKCGHDYPLILFFYTQGDDYSVAQGNILDRLNSKYNLTTIYAINYNTENPAVISVREIYNIARTPSLVINEKTYNRRMSLDEIEGILYEK